MSYARSGHAQAPYAGTVLPAPNVGQLPPPIPGDPAAFSYASSLAAYPWAYGSWAGGFPPATYPGGGVLIHPDAEHGVMEITAWWPDAMFLQLVRITPDGIRSPVRGGYPLRSGARPTRRNYATNPSLEVGLNGYVPDAGSPTLTQLEDVTAPAGSYVLRATVAGAGSNGVTVPTSLTTPAGQQVTVGWSMRTSARPTSVTLSIGWTNASGAALTPNSAALTADQINLSVNQWGRQVVTVTPPAGAATPTVKITAGGMPAGGSMDLDAIVIDLGVTDGSAFDGTTLGAVWAGTAHLSASVLAPIYTLLDGECPLDTLVTYQVSFPGITGGRVISNPELLPSNGRLSWLTHPADSGAPLQIDLRRKPKLDRPILQGVFRPIGRRHKVVVSAPERQASEGTIEFNALSAADRNLLLDMFRDGSPVLVRAPALYNYEPQWISLATVTEDPEDRLAWQDAWLISAPFIEVEAPSALA